MPQSWQTLPRAEKEQQKAARSREERFQSAHPTPCLRPGCPGHSRQGRCPQEEVPTGAIAAALLLFSHLGRRALELPAEHGGHVPGPQQMRPRGRHPPGESQDRGWQGWGFGRP